MSYLLDTCVISEFVSREPDSRVRAWLSEVNPETTYLSVVTIGEIQKGIEKLATSRRKEALQLWLKDDLLVRFRGRVLPLDTEAMLTWGSLVSRMSASGTPMPLLDSLIAATALHNDLVLVTRNEDDFRRCGATLLNPWA